MPFFQVVRTVIGKPDFSFAIFQRLWTCWHALSFTKLGITADIATLKKKGLELMTRDGLIAMIPVDHAMALKKRWGKMPLLELADRLNEKTNCRVLRVAKEQGIKMKYQGIVYT